MRRPTSTSVRERHEMILALVNEQGTVRSSALESQLRVSRATLQSDLRELARQNCLRVVRGGATRLPAQAVSPAFCNSTSTYAHAPVLLKLRDGSLRQACCPHCGLLSLITQHAAVVTVQVTDVLSGTMVAAQAATYVFEPQLRGCCTPAILAFANRHDAERFQLGFGGQVVDLAGALERLHPLLPQ